MSVAAHPGLPAYHPFDVTHLLIASGSGALGVVITLSIVVPLVVLGVVCWLFLRSARRFDADEMRRPPS